MSYSEASTLLDPCEKEPTDVLSHLSEQEREDITSSAQHALRLISFNQIYKILAIERLYDVRPPHLTANNVVDRKRPLEDSGSGESTSVLFNIGTIFLAIILEFLCKIF